MFFPAGKYKGLSGIYFPERPSSGSLHMGLKNNGLPHDTLKFYICVYHAPFLKKSKEPPLAACRFHVPVLLTKRDAQEELRTHIKRIARAFHSQGRLKRTLWKTQGMLFKITIGSVSEKPQCAFSGASAGRPAAFLPLGRTHVLPHTLRPS
jgi:hypothetical protein